MDYYYIIMKLIGEIEPIGETYEDDKRFENLKRLTDLVETLIIDIEKIVYNNKDRHEFSMKRAGEFSEDFLNRIKAP